MQTVLFAAASGAALGHYAAADRVRAGVQGLFTAFGNALLPGLAQRQSAGHAPWRLVALQVAVAALMAGGLALWAGPVVRLLAGPGWESAVPVLRVLALALVSSTVLSAVGVQVLLPAGRARAYSLALVALLAAQLAGLWWAAPQGAVALAWVLLLAEAGVALVLTCLAWSTRRIAAA
jgi:PST family polysaccharide transporter